MDTNRKIRVAFIMEDGRMQYIMSKDAIECFDMGHRLAFLHLVSIGYRIAALEDLSVFGELQNMRKAYPNRKIVMVRGYGFEYFHKPLTEGIGTNSYWYLSSKDEVDSSRTVS